jgi:hypothetical protein
MKTSARHVWDIVRSAGLATLGVVFATRAFLVHTESRWILLVSAAAALIAACSPWTRVVSARLNLRLTSTHLGVAFFCACFAGFVIAVFLGFSRRDWIFLLLGSTGIALFAGRLFYWFVIGGKAKGQR